MSEHPMAAPMLGAPAVPIAIGTAWARERTTGGDGADDRAGSR